MKYWLLGMLVFTGFIAAAQDCLRLVVPAKNRLESIPTAAYVHKDYVCPDDTLMLYAVRDTDKMFLTCLPSPCVNDVCEFVIRKSYYEIEFADSVVLRYDEPYLTSYSTDEFFILLQGRVRVRNFTGRKLKPKYKYAYANSTLLNKLVAVPVKSIQMYHAVPRANWDEDKKYKLQYKPGDKLQLSHSAAMQLMHSLQCTRGRFPN